MRRGCTDAQDAHRLRGGEPGGGGARERGGRRGCADPQALGASAEVWNEKAAERGLSSNEWATCSLRAAECCSAAEEEARAGAGLGGQRAWHNV